MKRRIFFVLSLSAVSGLLSPVSGHRSPVFGLVSPVSCYAQTLNRAEVLYLQGNYSESIEECGLNIRLNKSPDQAYYLLGLNYLKLSDGEKAREKIRLLLDNFPGSPYRQPAGMILADSYFIQQDYLKAKDICEGLLASAGQTAPALYLRLSLCSLKIGEWEKAREYANILKQRYPQSLEARSAAEAISSGELFFTVQVGSFANIQNARKLLNKLTAEGFEAYIDELNSAPTALHRVRVGKVEERLQAEFLKNRLEEKGYPARIYP